MKPNDIEKDTRKSPDITFFGIRCSERGYCCVARDERMGSVFGQRACDEHLAPLVLEATRTFMLPAWIVSAARCEELAASAASLAGRTSRPAPCTSGAGADAS